MHTTNRNRSSSLHGKNTCNYKMAESIIHELNAQFNDLDLKSKNKMQNKDAWKEDSTANKKSKYIDAEEHCMPYHTLTDSKDITYICSLCGGNLYANITNNNVLKENLHYKLICPRGCTKPQNKEVTEILDDQQLQAMGAEYNYSSCQPHDMVAMHNHDFRFNLTTDLMAARTARLKQLLNTIDCDN